MVRLSRKRKAETIVISDSEDEDATRSRSVKAEPKRQPLRLSQSSGLDASVNPHKPAACPVPVHPATAAARSAPQLHRCTPSCSSELVVQKKKVEQICTWMQAENEPCLLFLSGAAGCGKSCVITVLAAELGLPVRTWDAPTPTLWHEHLQQRAAGINMPYTSKLDEFEQFIQHAKLSMLPMHALGTSKQQKYAAASQPLGQTTQAQHLLLIEDLPHCTDAQQRQRLLELLTSLAGAAPRKTVITVTDTHTQGQNTNSSGNANRGIHKEIATLVEAGHAVQISLNPITKANTEKALQRVITQNGLAVASQTLASIAEAANGDLRNALETLQVTCAGVPVTVAAGTAKKGVQGRKRAKAGAKQPTAKQASVAHLGKDTGLALFHALGKVLYNKRLHEVDDASSSAGPSIAASQGLLPSWSKEIANYGAEQRVANRHQRQPTDVNPEAVLAKSDMECSTAAAFLHENMLEFVDGEAIEDAANACLHLSSSGALLDHDPLRTQDWDDDSISGQSLTEAAAGSVLLRGLMYSMCHPAPRRFLSLRSPLMFTNSKAAALNVQELRELSWMGDSWLGSSRLFASDLVPYIRLMASRPKSQHAHILLPKTWCHVHNGALSQHYPRRQYSDSAQVSLEGASAMAGLSLADAEVDDEIQESE